MRWYYKSGLAIGLVWSLARVLGAYGEAARELDIAFLMGFMLTVGGWSAAFLVVDWIARAIGFPRRPPPGPPGPPGPSSASDGPPNERPTRPAA